VVLHRLNSAETLIQRATTEAPRQHMYYIGLDVHKKTISYCVKDASGRIQQEGKVGCWMKTLPQPWSVGMEATIFSGWNYDHLLSHATQIKVAHPLMLRAIAAHPCLNLTNDLHGGRQTGSFHLASLGPYRAVRLESNPSLRDGSLSRHTQSSSCELIPSSTLDISSERNTLTFLSGANRSCTSKSRNVSSPQS
jgi:hypothetical protein